MGYAGKGLGKSENGITEAVKIDESRTLGFKDTAESNTKCLYIASSSMLNRIDEKRLSSSHLRVIVRSHGGCKIKSSSFDDKSTTRAFIITNDLSTPGLSKVSNTGTTSSSTDLVLKAMVVRDQLLFP